MVNVSVKRVPKMKLQQEIEDSQVAGWSLKSQNENLAILSKYGGWGTAGWHILIAICSAWWTLFIGNILYAIYAHYSSKQELQIKADIEE